MGNFIVRLSDELHDRLREKAFREKRKMSVIVREAIEENLGVRDAPTSPTSSPPLAPPSADKTPAQENFGQFSCPVVGCDFGPVRSDKATCPRHGRKVQRVSRREERGE